MDKSKWKIYKLGEVATYVNGFAFKPSDWTDNGLPIIRIQNLTNSEAEYNYYNKEIPAKYKVVKGDILVSWSATLGVFEWDKEDAYLNQHIFKVVFDKGCKITKEYFKYAISQAIDEMRTKVHGLTMQHIVKSDFDNTEIPVPPIEEQRRIVEELDLLNGMEGAKEQQLKELDALAQSTFYTMFGDPITNEKGWEVRLLKDVGSLGRGVSKHRPRNAPELLGGTMPLIQTGDIAKSGMFVESFIATYSDVGVRQSKVWPKGTLCITIAANIGECSILTFDACFPDSVVGFIADNKQVLNEYIYFLFGCIQKDLEENAPAVAQKNINLNILEKLKTPVPPLPLQQSFAQKIEAIEQQKQLIRQSLVQTQNLLAATLQKYFGQTED